LRAGSSWRRPAILKLAGELANALAQVHARGLTHLDIAPDTVSLASGRLELTDFAVDNRPFMPLLESQHGLVRPGYSPIEHHDASMAEPLAAPADVYAASACCSA
jgi:serine/threonine protein kinase